MWSSGDIKPTWDVPHCYGSSGSLITPELQGGRRVLDSSNCTTFFRASSLAHFQPDLHMIRKFSCL